MESSDHNKKNSFSVTDTNSQVQSSKRNRNEIPSRVPLAVDTRVGAYLIGKVIGKGGFSIVYSGLDTRNGEKVIIKEYYPRGFARRRNNSQLAPFGGKLLLAFAEGFRQFLNEALALKKMTHPNVMDVQNFIHANNTAYMVSPDNGGRCLKWFVGTLKEPLEQALLYQIFLPVMSALNFLHEAQVLHLDIKPSNILLQPNRKPLLLDFGATRIMNGEGGESFYQTLTPGFASPELYDKTRIPGPRCDIYAVGAALFFCITGIRPANSRRQKIASSLDIKRYEMLYSPAMLKSVNRALSLESSERYVSIDDFAAALLEGSDWSSLQEYELDVMHYDRSIQTTRLYLNEELRQVA